jgi:hypothetical protein
MLTVYISLSVEAMKLISLTPQLFDLIKRPRIEKVLANVLVELSFE